MINSTLILSEVRLALDKACERIDHAAIADRHEIALIATVLSYLAHELETVSCVDSLQQNFMPSIRKVVRELNAHVFAAHEYGGAASEPVGQAIDCVVDIVSSALIVAEQERSAGKLPSNTHQYDPPMSRPEVRNGCGPI